MNDPIGDLMRELFTHKTPQVLREDMVVVANEPGSDSDREDELDWGNEDQEERYR